MIDVPDTASAEFVKQAYGPRRPMIEDLEAKLLAFWREQIEEAKWVVKATDGICD